MKSSIEQPTRPASGRPRDGPRSVFGLVAEAVLQIARHREIDRVRDRAGVVHGLVARHVAVAPAEGAGKAAAGRSQRLEPQAGQDAGRAGVERVGEDEGFRALVQGMEPLGLFGLGGTVVGHGCDTL